jgi:hypothetical protein
MSLLFLSPRKHRPAATTPRHDKENSKPTALLDEDEDLCEQLFKMNVKSADVTELENKIKCLESDLASARADRDTYCEEVRILKGTSDRLSSMPLSELREVLREVEAHAAQLRSQVVSRALSSGLCVACHEKERSVVLLPCKHLSLCEECSGAVKSKCPMCREKIDSKMHVFV